MRGRVELAALSYTKSLDVEPDDEQIHYNLARLLAQRGSAGEAEAHLRAALRIDPRFALAHNNLGTLLRAGGDLPGAASRFEKAIEADPALMEAHYNSVDVAFKRSRWNEALVAVERVRLLEGDPDHAEARQLRAQLLMSNATSSADPKAQ
jgi:tetratricopeptide (TPR) repeat protein